mmetsp:Transcript_44266/g.87810  ORF Transcript_44266/g.87810 Transcript_44266/m.87810 type:complete len:203 (-) Transcript_44266:100-708(-)
MAMASEKRPLVLPALILASALGAVCFLRGGSNLANPAFATGSSHLPQAERFPRDPSGYGLGSQPVSSTTEVVAYTHVPFPHERPNKIDVFQPPKFGEQAYHFSNPPYPRRGGGFNSDGSLMQGEVAKCERQYTECFKVCIRFKWAKQKRLKNDCKHDCHREMRSCMWNAQPEWAKIREEFWTPQQKEEAEKYKKEMAAKEQA